MLSQNDETRYGQWSLLKYKEICGISYTDSGLHLVLKEKDKVIKFENYDDKTAFFINANFDPMTNSKRNNRYKQWSLFREHEISGIIFNTSKSNIKSLII